MNDAPGSPGGPKSVTQWIEQALGVRLPNLPQTVRNLDKAGAALLDLGIASLEVRAKAAREGAAREEKLKNALAKAMELRLGKAAPDEVKRYLNGMVLDYLSRHGNRMRVFELAANELEEDPPKEDAKGTLDDDWMAFFKGKVDALGSEEARLLFAKVLAGEVKQPGLFSKRAVAVLAEMSQRTARLFEILCNMSSRMKAGEGVRVITTGIGRAGSNALKPFGLDFTDLNELNDAGLIIAGLDSGVRLPSMLQGLPFEIGGARFVLEPNESMTHAERLAAIPILSAVVFTSTGRELRSIVALEANPAYVAKLTEGFADKGFKLKRASQISPLAHTSSRRK